MSTIDATAAARAHAASAWGDDSTDAILSVAIAGPTPHDWSALEREHGRQAVDVAAALTLECRARVKATPGAALVADAQRLSDATSEIMGRWPLERLPDLARLLDSMAREARVRASRAT